MPEMMTPPEHRTAQAYAERLAWLEALETEPSHQQQRRLGSRAWAAVWPKALAIVIVLAVWELIHVSGWKKEIFPGPGATLANLGAGVEAPFPTAIPGVITASGTEPSAPPGALAAPAQHVLTLRPGGEYDFETGSSVAAAEVSGVIALLMAASPTHLTPGALVSLLRDSAPAHDPTQAATVDVNAALARLDAGGASRATAH
jgi:hypothetical protein